MAKSKKKKKGKQATDTRVRDELVCNFAYSLATAPEGSGRAELKKEMIRVWKESSVSDDEGLSQAVLAKYKQRALITDPSFDRIANTLKLFAAKGNADAIMLAAIGSFSNEIFSKLKPYKDQLQITESMPASQIISMLFDCDARQNWSKIQSDWSPAVLYFREFTDKDQLYSSLEENGLKRFRYLESVANLFLDDGIYINGRKVAWGEERDPDAVTDSVLIASYDNESEFYDACMKIAYQRFKYFEADFLYLSSSPTFGAYNDMLAYNWRSDVDAKNHAIEIMKEDEKKSSILSMDYDEDSPCPSLQDWVSIWLAEAVLDHVYAYARQGIDVLALCRRSSVSEKEARLIVKEAFLMYDTDVSFREESYSAQAVRKSIVRNIATLWIDRVVSKQAAAALSSKMAGPKSKDIRYQVKRSDRIIADLSGKIESLQAELDRERANAVPAKKDNGEAKALRSEIVKLKAELESKDQQIGRVEREVSDLREIFRMSLENGEPGAEKGPATREEAMSEEAFREYIHEHKVLIWGLRDSTESKYMALYPDLSFTPSYRKLTKQQLLSYDVLIMCTSYTNHASFWAARDTAKAAGIPMAYLEKTANDPECLRRALNIAVGEGASVLH